MDDVRHGRQRFQSAPTIATLDEAVAAAAAFRRQADREPTCSVDSRVGGFEMEILASRIRILLRRLD